MNVGGVMLSNPPSANPSLFASFILVLVKLGVLLVAGVSNGTTNAPPSAF